MSDREDALSTWMMMWPDSLHVEHQFDPAYIAQREAFIDGFIAGRADPKPQPQEQS